MNDHFAAYLFLILAFLTPGIVVFAYLRSLPFTFFQSCLYLVARLLTRLLWRTKVLNQLDLPDGQGAIIVANHRSSIDPFFIQAFVLRKTHWMVAKEYCVNPLFGWFLRAVEVIPTNRGGIDTASTKAAIRFASAGELVGIFPEGRLNTSNEFMLPVRAGAALVAIRAKVPIVPCYIEGSPFREAVWTPFFMPARVIVRYGAPIEVTAPTSAETPTEAHAQILVKSVRGIAELAGKPEFEPKLAGRRWKTGENEGQNTAAHGPADVR